MPTTSNLNETGVRAPCTDTQGPERFASMLRVIFSVMDAFEVFWVLVLCVEANRLLYV
jgi:hypothetical protein